MEPGKSSIRTGLTAWCICVLAVFNCYAGNIPQHESSTRKPAVAGTFYPADSRQLESMIQTFIKKAGKPVIKGDLAALMSPHAGYVYSGQVAAYSYREIVGRSYDSVILIGPSHRVPIRGAAVFTRGYYETPLGRSPVNTALAKKIVDEHKFIRDSASPHHSREHCLETQLPFLQTVLKDFSIIPILIGQADMQFYRTLGEQIAAAIKDTKTLIIASTDLSHFPPYEIAYKVDNEILNLIKKMDFTGLQTSSQNFCRTYSSRNLDTCICGESAILTTMYAVKQLNASKVKILHYANSGDIPSGEKSRVVGYGAAAFYK